MATKKFVSKDNLSRVWTRLFGKVLNSKEEIEANTSENMIAGAEAVKEVYSSLQDQPTFEYDETGKITGYKTKVGADTVFPFKNGADVVWTNPNPNAQMKSTITVNFDFTKYSHIAISVKGHYQADNKSLGTQLFSTLKSSGTLLPGGSFVSITVNQNYARSMTFNKSNNNIEIKPNTSVGNYESYTIPIRIWGLNIDADFSSI